jgi:hypothetical protein
VVLGFTFLCLVGPQSSGVDHFWLKNPNGNVIMNESLSADTQPLSPPGYFGKCMPQQNKSQWSSPERPSPCFLSLF